MCNVYKVISVFLMSSTKVILFVILAQAGIHSPLILQDSLLRGNDGVMKIQGFYESITPELLL